MPRLKQNEVLASVKDGHVTGRFISPRMRFFRDDFHSQEVEVTDAVFRLRDKNLITIENDAVKGTAKVKPA